MSEKPKNLFVSLLPMTSTDDSLLNLQNIKNSIHELPRETRLLCLPENSLYLNLDQDPIPKKKAFGLCSPEIEELQKIARTKKIFIHLGGIPWIIRGKVFNEALLITDRGEVMETYEKIHLFDVHLGAGMEVCESNSYTKGERLAVFTVDQWKFATCICYDLRFPEIFIHYMENEQVDAFIVPATFTVKTGKLHWMTLLKARAIECQSYILAPAQAGLSQNFDKSKSRKSWGQSLAIDPWGEILKRTGNYDEFLDSDETEHQPISIVMETTKMMNYRKSIPISHHRSFKMELVKK